MRYTYVFGPVESGRLGRSLGLDLLGSKICTMDCVYCEVGPTRRLTCARQAYAPARDILDELGQWVEAGHAPQDVVTLGGMGEPTLNADMAEVMAGARRIMPGTPLAVLTNSTLMSLPEVREALMEADVVLPSMDALDPGKWRAVNRPHPSLDPAEVAEAVASFAREFKGKLFLEILLVRGMNDAQEDLDKMRGFLAGVRPDRVDVVTMSRPGTEMDARAVDPATLERWQRTLGAEQGKRLRHLGQGREKAWDGEELAHRLAASIARRPQSAAQLARTMEASREAVQTALDGLCNTNQADKREQDGEFFYSARKS